MIPSFRRAFILGCWVCCTFGPPAASAAGVAAVPAARQFDFLIGQWQVSGEAKMSGLMARPNWLAAGRHGGWRMTMALKMN
jgi:monoamine oxidase